MGIIQMKTANQLSPNQNWIAFIPSNWQIIPFKRIIKQNDGGIWGEDPSNSSKKTMVLRSTEQTIDGQWNIQNPAYRDLSKLRNVQYYELKAGDLLITKSSGSQTHIGKTTLVTTQIEALHPAYSNFMQRIRLSAHVNPSYYWYILNSPLARTQFAYLQNSTSGLGNLNATDINQIVVPLPPLDDQIKISAFLTHKCSLLDELIHNQQKQIDALNEYKRSLITEAVTKGLDHNIPMKDSEIKWYGKIPAHWKLVSLKRLFNIVAGGTPKSDIAEYWDGDVSWVTPADFSSETKYINNGKRNISKNGLNACSAVVVPAGSLIFSKRAPIGAVSISTSQLATNQGCFACTPKRDSVSVDYYFYLLSILDDVFNAFGSGTTFKEISSTSFSQTLVPVPPLVEQQSIATYITKEWDTIKVLKKFKQDKIQKLQDYKKSLIYEYVTGKKEVC